MTATETSPRTAEAILSGRIVAIIRLQQIDQIDAIIETLAEAGVKAMEVTLNTPDALDIIRRSRKRLGADLFFGAGTVLSPGEIDQAADAGAQFFVTPNCDPAVIRRAGEKKLPIFPGCFSPTEIAAAIQAGASAIKLFPASLGGPEYIKTLLGPFNNLRIIAVGGVSVENAQSYFDAGAAAVGLGSLLIGGGLVDTKSSGISALRSRAQEIVNRLGPQITS